MGAFLSIDVYFFWLAQIIGKYNRLVIACIVNFAKKNVIFFGFCRFASFFFCIYAPQLMGNLAFKTTSAEDTHLH